MKVGQVSAKPSGTDVHILVINLLQAEVRDIDVTCRASDAQGLQVGEASTRIVRIAPADIAFDRVLFPYGTVMEDDKFICDIAKAARVSGGEAP